jgi:hypothetical protein
MFPFNETGCSLVYVLDVIIPASQRIDILQVKAHCFFWHSHPSEQISQHSDVVDERIGKEDKLIGIDALPLCHHSEIDP